MIEEDRDECYNFDKARYFIVIDVIDPLDEATFRLK